MQKIVINNFRQIKTAEIDIKKILVFIGEQASGKSTIAKLIYFFQSLPQDYVDIVFNNGEQLDMKKIQTALIKKIQDKFSIYFGFTKQLPEDFRIDYYYSKEFRRKLTLSKSSSLQISFSSNFWQYIATKTDRILQKYQKAQQSSVGVHFSLKEKQRSALLEEITKTSHQIFRVDKECLFLPAGRNITVSYPEQFQLLFFGALSDTNSSINDANSIDMKLIKEFMSYSKFLIDFFAKYDSMSGNNAKVSKFIIERMQKILHGKYVNVAGRERIYYNGEDSYVPLSIASSGQQESIRILQDLIYMNIQKNAATRIIEEPETHLYPTAQKLLIEMIAYTANVTKSQFIITTHSPFVISVLNNLLYLDKALKTHPEKSGILLSYFGVGETNKLSISFDDFQAYALGAADEYCHSILAEDVRLIGDNYIDKASEDIADDFDFIYSQM